MYLGRQQLGTELLIPCLTVDGSGLPTAPDVSPSVRILSGTTLVMSAALPVVDRYGAATNCTYFVLPVFLDGRFSVGSYDVIVEWEIGGTVYAESGTFAVVAGGDSGGAVIAMVLHHRPESDFVVYQTTAGTLERGRGPKLP